jgi:hypothetical protein
VDGPPFVIRNGKGWLEVFVRGIDSDLLHIKMTGDPDNPWSEWESLGRPGGNLDVPRYEIGLGWNYPDAAHPDGSLEVFVVEGQGNDIWHTWET